MRRVILATLLLAAACDKAPTVNDSGPVAGTATNATAAVSGLSDPRRRAVFLRAIRDAGIDCQGVTAAEQIESRGGLPRWRARCTDGRQYLIDVAPDGTAHILSRIER
ncbi:hypothetical protein LZK98_05180 [Sphingomonas cannabina]|uniref:hypothetical protein n=1 Tax=Sphingomonas cannabina TaxID=2899123 RepID=UPI001F2B2D1C|nr:hypothetical protein [Sphingomonas cannabina]UIJ46338.1 hypothetical protein LZK98_05180 [Sphingomonas cannabina]